jgi:hypothetical protein
MTNTNFRGPANSLGAMEDSTVGEDDGPNYIYQGTLFPNLRGGLFNKDGFGAGRVPGFMDNPQIVSVDNIPSSASTTILAAASTTLSGTGATLVTVAPGNTTAGVPSVATGVPIIAFGTSTPVTAALALDFGFTTGTTTAASTTLPVVDTTLFTQGQWIAIGGAGNAAKTATLLTQVQAINATTLSIAPAALGTLANAPIGGANLFNQSLPYATQFGPGTPAPNAVANELAAGMFRIFNPIGAIARNLTVTATATAAAGGAFKVSGWDIHLQAMTESITVAAATTVTAFGKKAFKYVASVIPQFTDATGTYSIGVGDTFGFPVRADRQEYTDWSWAGNFKTTQTGFTAPVLTTATSTSGDVRGTLQVSALGAGTGIGTTVSNGINRLFIVQTLPLWNTISGTPTNTVPFYGQNQA